MIAPTTGFNAGDLAAVLDPELASILGEIIAREKDCEVSRLFDKEHPAAARKMRRAGRTPGNVLCGAQGAFQNMRPGGPLDAMLLLKPTSVHFDFAPVSGHLLLAVNQFKEFVSAYRPMLSLQPGPADDRRVPAVGLLVIAMGVNVAVESVALGALNRIKGSLISTSDSSTNPSGKCTSPPHSSSAASRASTTAV